MTVAESIAESAEIRLTATVLDPKDPRASARAFLKERHTTDAQQTLYYHQCEFFSYNGCCYPPTDSKTVRAELWAFLDEGVTTDRKPFQPTTSKVNNVVDALEGLANLPASVKPPTWLKGPGEPAREIVACANGLYHLPSGKLLPPTPSFYSHNSLNFDYDETAAPPVLWLEFLNEIWPDDQESVDTLQQAFGYCLTPDTSQQKILMLVGPKRSGKGTIGRVLRSVVGPDNVCAPTLASLSTNFGLAPLIGRTLAIVADARFRLQSRSGGYRREAVERFW